GVRRPFGGATGGAFDEPGTDPRCSGRGLRRVSLLPRRRPGRHPLPPRGRPAAPQLRQAVRDRLRPARPVPVRVPATAPGGGRVGPVHRLGARGGGPGVVVRSPRGQGGRVAGAGPGRAHPRVPPFAPHRPPAAPPRPDPTPPP